MKNTDVCVCVCGDLAFASSQPGRDQRHQRPEQMDQCFEVRASHLARDEETFRAATLEIAAALPPCSERQGAACTAGLRGRQRPTRPVLPNPKAISGRTRN